MRTNTRIVIEKRQTAGGTVYKVQDVIFTDGASNKTYIGLVGEEVTALDVENLAYIRSNQVAIKAAKS